MLNKRADKLELIRIAEAVALEKSIDKELIISSMETGIAKAAKSKFGQDNEIKVSINRDNGDIEIFRKLLPRTQKIPMLKLSFRMQLILMIIIEINQWEMRFYNHYPLSISEE